jgi:hypothetical protein
MAAVTIGLHGKNLFDKEYIVAGYNFVAGGFPPGTPIIPTLGREGTLTGFYGDPRRIFVTAKSTSEVSPRKLICLMIGRRANGWGVLARLLINSFLVEPKRA